MMGLELVVKECFENVQLMVVVDALYDGFGKGC